MSVDGALYKTIVLVLALVFPWINPFSPGPTPAVVPWLVSAACGLTIFLLRAHLTHRRVAVAWLLAAVLSAVIGLMQYFGRSDWFGALGNFATAGEAYANLRQRNQFATLLSTGLFAWLWLQSQTGIDEGRAGQHLGSLHPMSFWTAPSLMLLAIGNAASQSRTGSLQWVVIVALTAVWHIGAQRRLFYLTAIAFGLYVVSALALPSLLAMATGIQSDGLLGRLQEEPGCASRTVLWSNVIHLIAQKPWLGWGWGELDYAHFMTLYPGERFCDILDNAHNLPLHMAVELGVPFAVTVCGALAWAVIRFRPWRDTDPTRQLAWGVLAVIALHSLLEYPLWYGPFQMATVLSIGLLCKAIPANAPPAPVKSALAAIICIAILAWAGFDYWRVSQLYLSAPARSPAYQENTLEKVRGSRLFSNQVAFAEFTTTTLTPENALALHAMGLELLHFSPEPRVIEKVITSADLLGQYDEAAFYRVRYRAAFPEAYLRWVSDSTQDEAP